MFQCATVAGISPLRLSFTGSLQVIKRAVPLFQQIDLEAEVINVYYSWLIWEILDLEIPPAQQRSNPRVVKKTRSKFKSKKRLHRGNGTVKQQLTFKVFETAAST